MKISIFGLGYVGCVGAACSAELGHSVIGVDLSKTKVDLLNSGKPTIIEEGIEKLLYKGYSKGLIEATQDYEYAIQNSNISFIVVGTPSTKRGHLKLDYIFNVSQQIAEALKFKNDFHVVVIRSTVLPGTNEKVSKIIEEISGKKTNVDFAVVSNPEFLREGSAIKDYFNPPLTLVGSESQKAIDIMKKFYKDINADFISTDIKVAEIMKYVNNTYHALKIVFANEVGNVCKELGIDSHEVMDIFSKDKQLNISSYYFKPGFAYGGSCLPKDSKALRTLAHDLYIDTPVINSIAASNQYQIEKSIQLIKEKGVKKIGILGLSFKAGTDDLRNSPIVEVIESLIGQGYEVSIYDKNVKMSEITGTNREFIDAKIPHLKNIIYNDLDLVVRTNDLIVITNREKEFKNIIFEHENKIIIDLVRVWERISYNGLYEGISWKDINDKDSSKFKYEKDVTKTDF